MVAVGIPDAFTFDPGLEIFSVEACEHDRIRNIDGVIEVEVAALCHRDRLGGRGRRDRLRRRRDLRRRGCRLQRGGRCLRRGGRRLCCSRCCLRRGGGRRSSCSCSSRCRGSCSGCSRGGSRCVYGYYIKEKKKKKKVNNITIEDIKDYIKELKIGKEVVENQLIKNQELVNWYNKQINYFEEKLRGVENE